MIQVKLKNNQKEKLIETLLIVGALLAAFRTPEAYTWLFSFFTFSSIVYLILLWNKNDQKILNIVAFLEGVFFAGIFGFFLGNGLINWSKLLVGVGPELLIPVQLGCLILFVSISYIVFLSYLIYCALRFEKA